MKVFRGPRHSAIPLLWLDSTTVHFFLSFWFALFDDQISGIFAFGFLAFGFLFSEDDCFSKDLATTR
jgi:hypothetical protein